MSLSDIKCDKCKSYLIVFPCSKVCPKCQNNEVFRLAKKYTDLQMEKEGKRG